MCRTQAQVAARDTAARLAAELTRSWDASIATHGESTAPRECPTGAAPRWLVVSITTTLVDPRQQPLALANPRHIPGPLASPAVMQVDVAHAPPPSRSIPSSLSALLALLVSFLATLWFPACVSPTVTEAPRRRGQARPGDGASMHGRLRFSDL